MLVVGNGPRVMCLTGDDAYSASLFSLYGDVQELYFPSPCFEPWKFAGAVCRCASVTWRQARYDHALSAPQPKACERVQAEFEITLYAPTGYSLLTAHVKGCRDTMSPKSSRCSSTSRHQKLFLEGQMVQDDTKGVQKFHK
ncbi:hypothetical protein HBH53_226120 [Parastagonospora nodorum]|nr:hypothetical protein HBH53_226120 [Parastagonospora nodorum]